MIRTILGLLVPAALRAIDEAEARATAADANCHVEQGRCAELRDLFAAGLQTAENLRFDLSEALDRATAQAREIETLRFEVASASEECDEATELRIGLGRAEIRIGQLQRERDELQRRLDARGDDESVRLRMALSKANEYADRLCHDVNIANARIRELETQVAAFAVAVPVESEAVTCAWCLKPVGAYKSAVNGLDRGERLSLCKKHGTYAEPFCDDIRARVATRAASCPLRRVSPDPLTIACQTCGAMRGETCSAAPFLGKPGDSAR